MCANSDIVNELERHNSENSKIDQKTTEWKIEFFFNSVPYMQGARQRPAKLFQSASTEETTDTTENKTVPPTNKQPTKQRWSVLFGLKNPQQNQLCEILNRYAKSGVPQTHSIYSFEHIDLVPALDYLENIHSSWMEFVLPSSTSTGCISQTPHMSDNEIKIQSAIWELVTTEVDYIHALQTVTDVSVEISYKRKSKCR